MEYIAIAKNVKISPRKVRLVVDNVKKKKLASALLALTVMSKRASVPIKKAIDSAVANAINNFAAKREDLTIRDIQVTEGIAAKRFHFAARGRTRPYKRRASHIRVILSDNRTVEMKSTPSLPEGKIDEKKVDIESKTGGKE